ncbi:MAG: hypothetical protein JWM43_4 [Acidobacteriaceae bacterium]|nr:hypothetical protein [Acidobacteriaceae bacterium]
MAAHPTGPEQLSALAQANTTLHFVKGRENGIQS